MHAYGSKTQTCSDSNFPKSIDSTKSQSKSQQSILYKEGQKTKNKQHNIERKEHISSNHIT